MESAFFETLLNGLYSGAIGTALCLLYKEHRLLNLAGAGWACLGSWLWAVVFLDVVPFAEHGRAVMGLLVVGIAGLLGGFLYWKSQVFTKHPSLFVFLSLACHVAISIGGGNSIPSAISTTLPNGVLVAVGLPAVEPWALVLACVTVAVMAEALTRSPAYSRHVLSYRQGDTCRSVRRFLLGLLLTQLGLLLVLSTFAIPTNLGDFSLTSKHLATSAVATVACFGVPWRTFLASVALAFLEWTLYWMFSDTVVASAFSLILFIAGTILRVGPIPGLTLHPPNPWIKEFSITPSKFLAQLTPILMAPGLLWLLAAKLELPPSRLMTILAFLVLATLSYVSTRCSGISTAAFPAFGAGMAYLVVHAPTLSPAVAVALFVLCLSLFTAYLFFVRRAHHRIALITDLGLIIAAYELLGHRHVSGADAVIRFHGLHALQQFAPAFLCLWVLLVAALAFASWVHVSLRGRMVAHALSDPLLARQHGLNPTGLLVLVCCGLLLTAFGTQIILCQHMKSISQNSADPQMGIACLLVGYVMASDTPLIGFCMGLFLYLLPSDLLPLVGIRLEGQYVRLLLVVLIAFAIAKSPDAAKLWRRP